MERNEKWNKSILPSKAFSRSSADHDVGAALNGAARRIPSRLAIL